jgi:hypothetical protein
VRIDALALRMRPRAPLEAADLGVRLCQDAAGSVYLCYAVVAVPVIALAFAAYEIAAWLPQLLLWWSKPWLDRTILFVLSRAAFGQRTAPREVWAAQRDVWWRQLFLTLTWRRLSPWRAFTQPVYQLEGSSFRRLWPRVRQIRRRHASAALLMTAAFGIAELLLVFALAALVLWLLPVEETDSYIGMLFDGRSFSSSLVIQTAYAAAVLFLEPFYVAAGFGMYLSRRAELEAWDVEQELRRAFAA